MMMFNLNKIKRRLLFAATLCCLCIGALAQQANTFVKIETPQGACIIKLYNETPVHRDNFVRLAKTGYFDKTTFNRILKNFVIQGGDPDSLYEKGRKLKREMKWIGPEFNPALFHRRGVVAMGRDDNPEQTSFATQIYIVDGKKWTDEQLDALEKKYGQHFTQHQREVYKTTGGTPHLDQHYTIFGEIVKGIDLIDKLTALKVDKSGNPDVPVWMKVKVLNANEAAAALK